MRRGLGAVVLLAVLFGQPAEAQGPLMLTPGQAASQVQQQLGLAPQVSRQIFFRAHLEQWTYEGKQLRVELRWQRGDDGRVTTVTPLPPPR
jgi:hypothetical protein